YWRATYTSRRFGRGKLKWGTRTTTTTGRRRAGAASADAVASASRRRQNAGTVNRIGWSADPARHNTSALPAAPRPTLTSQGARLGGTRPASAAARALYSST